MRRIVMTDSSMSEDYKSLRNRLLQFFSLNNWLYIREHQASVGDDRPNQIGWVKGENRMYRIDFFDDGALGSRYFELTTRQPDMLDAMEQRVRSGSFALLTQEDILKEFAN